MLLGGVEALAYRLRTSRARVREWLAGESLLPLEAFLETLDLLADATSLSTTPPPLSADHPGGEHDADEDRGDARRVVGLERFPEEGYR